jgi:DNA-binding NarL/FixJ family response regulator
MLSLTLYIFFACTFFIDIWIDFREGIALRHILHEGFLFLVASLAALYQGIMLHKEKRKRLNAEQSLILNKESYIQWQKLSKQNAKAIRDAIDFQFENWQLSSSEKDVALLLIKGLSMKEIAGLRGTHEKTVRQQSTSLYKKAQLSGRQELAAFFLEDILSTPN